MIGRTNAVSKPGVELSLVVSVTSGAAVTATKGSKTVNGTAAGGSCVLSLPEAGTWSVKATLNGQTSDTKSVSVVDSYAVALTFFSATITVNVDSGASVTLKKGGTTIATKTSNGTAVFTVTETGAYTVTATKNGQTTSGSVNVVSGTTSYSLTLSFVSSTLNNNEWSVIKSVSDAGQGANYWSIGDRKAVTLNGTVGKLSLSNVTTYAFIIGFNHNASVEGANRIHFQLAKTALSGGTDVCFCDNQYGPDSGWSSPGAGYFVMNASNTNSGGVAYVWNRDGNFDYFCNMEMVELSLIEEASYRKELHELIRQHYLYTGSKLARTMLDDWPRYTDQFIQVVPIEYKKVLQEEQMRKLQQKIAEMQRD